MGKIICVANQKGGVGKSTTVLSIGQALIEKKKKVLFVDLDSQCNLTTLLSVPREGVGNSIDLLMNAKNIKDTIIHTEEGDVIPANQFLANTDMMLGNVVGREYRLKNHLDQIKDDYDYIIIDTPPALGTITINALTSSDEVIIPSLPDMLSSQGVAQIFQTINEVKANTKNKDLKVSGIVLTRYNARTSVTKFVEESLDELAKQYGTKVFKTKIRESVAVRESQAIRANMFSDYKKTNAVEDYRNLVKEIKF